MSDLDVLRVNPQLVGKWLQHAREAAGKRQQDAAAFLDVARTTITAIEKGERRVRPLELVRLAQLYGRQVSDLLRPEEPDDAFAIQLRAAIAPHEDVTEGLVPVVRTFQALAEDYLELERLTKSELPKRYPAERELPRQNVEQAAEDIAVEERVRLGLGDGPLVNLRDVLETEAGARIFYITMPSSVAGMFAFTDRIGPSIAVNIKQPPERRRASLAHEWGHFLVARRTPKVEVRSRFEREPAVERFANAFSRSFLMPRAGITRRFNEMARARGGRAQVADLLTLAHYYFVSLETLTLRLEELRLVTSGTMAKLSQQKLKVSEGRSLLGLEARAVSDTMVPARYIALAVQGYRDQLFSEGRLTEFLRMDRVATRAFVQGLS